MLCSVCVACHLFCFQFVQCASCILWGTPLVPCVVCATCHLCPVWFVLCLVCGICGFCGLPFVPCVVCAAFSLCYVWFFCIQLLPCAVCVTWRFCSLRLPRQPASCEWHPSAGWGCSWQRASPEVLLLFTLGAVSWQPPAPASAVWTPPSLPPRWGCFLSAFLLR